MLAPDYFTHFWGTDIRKSAFEHYANLDLQNNTLIIGFPDRTHRDSVRHCADKTSELFKNLYADIWDSGAQGTPVNDTNYFAIYVWNLVKTYKNQIKYWSIHLVWMNQGNMVGCRKDGKAIGGKIIQNLVIWGFTRRFNILLE
jgi:hypothetical protein